MQKFNKLDETSEEVEKWSLGIPLVSTTLMQVQSLQWCKRDKVHCIYLLEETEYF